MRGGWPLAFMKKLLLLLAVLSLAACSQLPMHEPAPQPLTEQEEDYLRELEMIGKDIYKKEVYAVHATEMLMRAIDPDDYPRFIGWLTLEFGGYTSVSFYQSGPFGVSIIADVNYNSENEPSLILDPQRPVSEEELAMLRAKNLALATGKNACAERFNTVLLESADEQRWDVYVIATPSQPNTVVVGGHSRVSIDKATGSILKYEPFSEHCQVISIPSQSLPSEFELQTMVMSYNLSDFPAPMHVFLGLLHRQKLIVDTHRGRWEIESGHISALDNH